MASPSPFDLGLSKERQTTMNAYKALAVATILPFVMGITHLAPAVAAPAITTQFKLIASGENSQMQTVDCRRYVHSHRRCTLWAGGVCRRWVRYTHRCG